MILLYWGVILCLFPYCNSCGRCYFWCPCCPCCPCCSCCPCCHCCPVCWCPIKPPVNGTTCIFTNLRFSSAPILKAQYILFVTHPLPHQQTTDLRFSITAKRPGSLNGVSHMWADSSALHSRVQSMFEEVLCFNLRHNTTGMVHGAMVQWCSFCSSVTDAEHALGNFCCNYILLMLNFIQRPEFARVQRRIISNRMTPSRRTDPECIGVRYGGGGVGLSTD